MNQWDTFRKIDSDWEQGAKALIRVCSALYIDAVVG